MFIPSDQLSDRQLGIWGIDILPSIDFRWILHVKGLFSKYFILYPLKSKKFDDIVLYRNEFIWYYCAPEMPQGEKYPRVQAVW